MKFILTWLILLSGSCGCWAGVFWLIGRIPW